MSADIDLQEKVQGNSSLPMRPVFGVHTHGVFIGISSASQVLKLVGTHAESKQNSGFSSVRMRCVRERGSVHPHIRNL